MSTSCKSVGEFIASLLATAVDGLVERINRFERRVVPCGWRNFCSQPLGVGLVTTIADEIRDQIAQEMMACSPAKHNLLSEQCHFFMLVIHEKASEAGLRMLLSDIDGDYSVSH